nr:uncharacterized protein LOC128687290 [Cherax quadricarinatus]
MGRCGRVSGSSTTLVLAVAVLVMVVTVYKYGSNMGVTRSDLHTPSKSSEMNGEVNRSDGPVAGSQDNYQPRNVRLTDETFAGRQQDDPELIQYICYHLHRPSSLPYNLSKPQVNDHSQYGQSLHLMNNILHGMKGGFFVEVGAMDGEIFSNTLYLEQHFQWTGLLIEPYPVTYRELLHKHRRAYSINAALSLTHTSASMKLSHSHLSIHETQVLKTIPWERIKFRVMCIENNHIPEGKKTLRKFMVSKGYKFLGERKIDSWFGWPELLVYKKNGS